MHHTKETHSKRLIDTAHFNHKNITKPTIEQADKIMVMITKCVRAMKEMRSENGKD
jgi:hypothetical protein